MLTRHLDWLHEVVFWDMELIVLSFGCSTVFVSPRRLDFSSVLLGEQELLIQMCKTDSRRNGLQLAKHGHFNVPYVWSRLTLAIFNGI